MFFIILVIIVYQKNKIIQPLQAVIATNEINAKILCLSITTYFSIKIKSKYKLRARVI